MNGIVCPLSMASGTPSACHPGCKMNIGGSCLLVLYLQRKLNSGK